MEDFQELQRKLDKLTDAYEALSRKLEAKELESADKPMVTGNGPGGSDQDNPFEQASMAMKLVAFLNAKHYMVFAGKKGQTHGHSWQFQADVSVTKQDDSFIKFENLDKTLNKILVPYQRMVLNDVPPFDQIEPLTENLAVYFFNVLYDELVLLKVHLNKLTVWENPTKGIEIIRKTDEFYSTNESNPIISAGIIKLHQSNDEAAAAIDKDAKFTADDEPFSDLSAQVSISASGNINEVADPPIEDIEEGPVESTGISSEKKTLLGFIGRRGKGISPPGGIDSSRTDFNHHSWWQILLAALIIIGASVWAYYPILTALPNHVYPHGIDTWGHLYKAEYLFRQILKGNYYPQFTPDWYNGTQLLRYWAPLPYYCLAGLRMFTPDIFTASNYYIFLCALVGGICWLTGRKYMGLWPACLAGVVWVIWPDNLKIAFAEGNLPRILTTALLPLAFWCFFKVVIPQQDGKRYWHIVCAVICVATLVLSHAMLTAIFCICFMMFAIISWLLGSTSFNHVIRGCISIIIGLALSSWWLLPSLKGGLMGMSEEAAGAPTQYISALSAFNPFHRFADSGAHYWGISLLFIVFLSVLFWEDKKGWAKSLFFCGLIFMVLTFPSFAWLQKILPLSYMLWPLRFSTFTCFAFIAFAFSFNKPHLRVFKVRKINVAVLLIVMFIALVVDSYYSYLVLPKTEKVPDSIYQCARQLSHSNDWRIATLDYSGSGSSPSYLFSFLSHHEQIFGWAYQGATTAQNIMLVNSSSEYNLYPYLFKELIHLGGTQLVVQDQFLQKPNVFAQLATRYGYRKTRELQNISVWEKHTKPYMIIHEKNCLAIGKHASIYALLFPQIEIGRSNLIDDYSPKELNSYNTIILSGANWYSKSKAEKRILNYAHNGGRVIVDFTGFPLDVLARQPKFLGIYAEPITINGQLALQSSEGDTIQLLPYFNELSNWKTYVPQGLDKTLVSCKYYGNTASVWGYKNIEGNIIWFMGTNLAYHAILTSDPQAIAMLKEFTGLSNKYSPEATVTFDNYVTKDNGYQISYSLDKNQDVIIPIADLDGFEVKIDGTVVEHSQTENLISLRLPSGHHIIDLDLKRPAVYKQGIFITVIGLASGIIWLLFMYRRERKRLYVGMIY